MAVTAVIISMVTENGMFQMETFKFPNYVVMITIMHSGAQVIFRTV